MARGGARPGSGRKATGLAKPKKPKAEAAPVAFSADGVKTKDAPPSWPFGVEPESLSELTPLQYLLSVVRDVGADERVRIQAASIAAPFMHAKVGEAGKKDEKGAAAKRVGAGKFAASAPPLKLVNR